VPASLILTASRGAPKVAVAAGPIKRRGRRRCFERAIEIASRQSAKSFELRATVSLARLLKQQGETDEAREKLAEIYGWFTEGFDTADLKDAMALLDELIT
jgi:predicted ATPase